MHDKLTCQRKVKYNTEGTAKRALDAMKKRGRDRLEVYRCKICKGFHLGHHLSQISITVNGEKLHFAALETAAQWLRNISGYDIGV